MIAGLAATTCFAAMPDGGLTRDRSVLNSANKRALPTEKVAKLEKLQVAPTMQSRASEMITEPEGEMKLYNMSGYGYYIYWVWIYTGSSDCAGQIVWGDNNEVYLKPAISSFASDAYVKGTVEGNKITVKYPQQIALFYDYDEDDNIVYLPGMVSLMKSDGEGDYVVVADEDNYMTYTIMDDGSVVMDLNEEFEYDDEGYVIDPEYMVTLYIEYGTEEESDPYWYYYGDIQQSFTPMTDVATELPAGVEMDNDWVLTDANNNALNIAVGFDGDDVYLGNLDPALENMYAKGTIKGEQVVFETQYMGLDEYYGYFVYMVPVVSTYEWDEEYEEWYYENEIADQLVFTYDKEAKRLTAINNGSLCVNTATDYLYYYDCYIHPVIQYQSAADQNANPKNPELTYFRAFDEDYGYGYMIWDIPKINVNDYLLNTEDMYYIFYVDGEEFTFYTDEYYGLEEDMTEIPWDFCDNEYYDIYAYSDGEHEIYFYQEGWTKVGMQSFFKGNDGELYKSELVTYNVGSTGIDTLTANKEVKAVTFYDINGRQISRPAQGFYIQKTVFTDGTTSVSKVARR
ncbi:MAG: hypothetical protein LIO90_08510 [Bacteroidales bacterium]|nr:hypothetical protein [Bacteroidales bacterium]